MFGSGYVIDHCIARFKQKEKDRAYRIYMTDGLKMISESVSNIRGGPYLNTRWWDIVAPKTESTKSPDEIITKIVGMLNGGDEDGPIRPCGKDNAG